MKIICAECQREYDDADCTTICPHNLLMPREDLDRKDAAGKILGRLVTKIPGGAHWLVVAVTSKGMVWLQGEVGEFNPKDLTVVPMKEHPIILSTEMVRAILEDRKTQTRRVVRLRLNKKQKEKGFPAQPIDILPMPNSRRPNGKEWVALMAREPESAGCVFTYPSLAGDRLWVRERWAHDNGNCRDIHCGNPDHIWYYANEEKIVADSFAGAARWRPSIHMERWASRLTLQIVSLRVERVQKISEADSMAEGAPLGRILGYGRAGRKSHREGFILLWDSINEKRGFGWDSNPWVWVIEFKIYNET